VGCIQACLDKVFAFWLSDEGLEFSCGEGVYKTCFRHDEQKNLGSSESGQLIGLFHNPSFPFGECDMTSRFILNKFDLDLSSSGFLLLWLIVFVFVVPSALTSVMVVDERVFGDGLAGGYLRWLVWVCGR